MNEYRINLDESSIKAIAELAQLRGVDANTVIQQAVATEKLIADNVGVDDELLIKKGSEIRKVVFK